MSRPSNEEVWEVASKIARRLARIYKFGYHEVEDFVQDSYIIAISSIDKYDSKRPLVNFLSIHLRNRFNNFKRDKFQRISKPCEKCPLGAWIKNGDLCKIYEIKEDCSLYYKWVMTNSAKKNLMQPTYIEGHEPVRDADFSGPEFKEVYEHLQNNLSHQNQIIMYKIMNGDKVRPTEIDNFRNEAMEILKRCLKKAH